jgi:heme-degrading monooxygenase HmoA
VAASIHGVVRASVDADVVLSLASQRRSGLEEQFKIETGDGMFWEIAQIEVKPGQEAAFEAAVAQAVPLFKNSPGSKGMQLHRSVEIPSRYRLVIDWQTVEDHTVHFRGSENFQAWRRLVGGFFASPPAVEHTQCVLTGF